LLALAAPNLPARAAADSATPRCATSNLVVWLDTQGDGAAGSVYYRLEFTNLSNRTCRLFGYPGVSAVDVRGRRLGSRAARNRALTPRPVTLARGASASAVLQIVQADNFATASCRVVLAAGLRVFPPDQTASKVVPFPFRACSRTGPVYLTVQAVRHISHATQRYAETRCGAGLRISRAGAASSGPGCGRRARPV
jgi:hypothetical protein